MSHDNSTEIMRDFIRSLTAPEFKPLHDSIQDLRNDMNHRVNAIQDTTKKASGNLSSEISSLKDAIESGFADAENRHHTSATKIEQLSGKSVELSDLLAKQCKASAAIAEKMDSMSGIIKSTVEETMRPIGEQLSGKSVELSDLLAKQCKASDMIAEKMDSLSEIVKSTVEETMRPIGTRQATASQNLTDMISSVQHKIIEAESAQSASLNRMTSSLIAKSETLEKQLSAHQKTVDSLSGKVETLTQAIPAEIANSVANAICKESDLRVAAETKLHSKISTAVVAILSFQLLLSLVLYFLLRH